jgi:hypothetical protein
MKTKMDEMPSRAIRTLRLVAMRQKEIADRSSPRYNNSRVLPDAVKNSQELIHFNMQTEHYGTQNANFIKKNILRKQTKEIIFRGINRYEIHL